MISPNEFLDKLTERSVRFYTGVPDSLLKDFCAYVQDHVPAGRHVIAANEGGAVALGAGHYLATGHPALVYMQNSGMGNALNPLISLNDPAVYGIPALLLIGWRGEPGLKDEPQHVKQGEIALSLLETMGIPYAELSSDIADGDLPKILDLAFSVLKGGQPFALVARKGTFAPYKLKAKKADISSLTREEAISTAAECLPEDAFIVGTTGKISRELYEYRDNSGTTHDRDFLTVGSMGHSSHIAAGIALSRPDKPVYCFDGDGAFLMHMGHAAVLGNLPLKNFVHIVFNNAAHDSVGGQPTVGDSVDFTAVAAAAGYKQTFRVSSADDIRLKLSGIKPGDGPVLLEIRVSKGARAELIRPKKTPKEQKNEFMTRLREGNDD